MTENCKNLPKIIFLIFMILHTGSIRCCTVQVFIQTLVFYVPTKQQIYVHKHVLEFIKYTSSITKALTNPFWQSFSS